MGLKSLIGKAASKISSKTATKMAILKDVSPHIAFGVGVAVVIGGTIYLCHQVHGLADNEDLAELEAAKAILDAAEEKLKNGDVEPTEAVNEKTIKAGRRKISAKAKLIVAKKVALAAAIIVIGLTMSTGGHLLLNHQKKDAITFGNTAMAMYNGLASRIKKELPPEDAAKMIFGKNSTIMDEGEEKAIFKDNTIKETTGDDVAPWRDKYDIVIDVSSALHCGSPIVMQNEIRATLTSLRDRLMNDGMLYFYDIYEAFYGNKSSKKRAIEVFGDQAGLVAQLPDGSDGTANLDWFAVIDSTDKATRDFLNGYSTTVVLHIKPHGNVADLLRRTAKAKRTGHWEKPFEYRGIGV